MPIISRTIKQLIKTKIFDLIIVSTDSNKIVILQEIVERRFLFKTKKISDDYTDTQTVIQHAIKWLKNKKIYAEFVCCVYQPLFFLVL